MIKIIIWLLVIFLFGSLILEIYKDFIFETMSYPLVQARFVLGFIFGFSLFYVISEGMKSKEKRSNIKFKASLWIFFVIAVVQVLNTVFLKKYFVYLSIVHIQFFKSVGLGFVTAIIFQRLWIWGKQIITSKNAVKSVLERDSKSDIRDLGEFSTQIKKDYDPKKYFRENGFFLALDEKDKPIYWTEKTLPHIEVCGMTGSGKGIFLGSIAAQCIKKGEAVFIIDPKDDEWLPHVAYAASQDANVSFDHLNTRESVYQFNLFQDTTEEEREELLLAGLELSDRGEASDFYKIADRKMASFVAETFKEGQTIESFYAEYAEFLEKEAPGFAGKFRELASIKAINAVNGLSLKKVVATGGVVYITGSMRNTKIVRVQKMLLVRLIQLAEARDRISTHPKPICVVLDELKYHISRTALEALGAARDKGLHVIMAHQSLDDLRDCPKDLEPDAVVGAVFENTKIKLVYRVEMPETAEIFAEKSGDIGVDVETRLIERSLSLAEEISSERKVSRSETNLIEKNIFLTLPKKYGVLFGVGLPKMVHTSRYRAEKDIEAVKTKDQKQDNEKSDLNEIDFGKLG
ncbi:type IV secretory system conjugative DNA transfer family protein [Acinetobacter brisouii]|uniref:type IV secretory system conjugative DNA transfer family protein n=1 Tax=Acinetobacter brisouii TaxID=396323 RepID=UPI000696FCDA|nr:TraM recognition domain-containing protein [Acinetobacter brisouii]